MMIITLTYSLHVLTGKEKAIGIAIRNNKVENRFIDWNGDWKEIKFESLAIPHFLAF